VFLCAVPLASIMDTPAPGFQRDGAGRLWCAIANSEWGRIPGKAKDGTCWFPYGGQEHETSDFDYYPVNTKSHRPRGEHHTEDENGRYYCAIAKTPHGKIPGKANEEGTCWYPYGGEEHTAEKFKYVSWDWDAESSSSSSDSDKEEIAPGFQTDGAGYLWCAVANTEHGKIPGKAKDGTCWYPYGGEEHETSDFDYVRVRRLSKHPRCDAQGDQHDGAGELWCAVAKSEHGKIPGKAKDGECWYPYGGEEHSTSNFKYAS